MIDFSDIFAKKTDFNIKYSLERISKIFKILGSPSSSIPSIIVGGTNGKGSVCAFLSAFFESIGLKVGLYTSPHLINFSERIYVSGEHIDDEYLRSEIDELINIAGTDLINDLSFFEITTLVAFRIFEKYKTNINVLEVGMGGRLDAVNIINPHISVIVTVADDHKQYLGNTIQKIACEKAGIMRHQQPVFLGMSYSQRQYAKALSVILDLASRINAKVYLMDTNYGLCENDSFYINLDSQNIYYRLPMSLQERANFLKRNYCLAAAVFVYYSTKFGGYNIHDIEQYLQHMDNQFIKFSVIKGRDQIVHVNINNIFNHVFLFDVCHNVEGILSFKEALSNRYFNQLPLVGFVSILQDKDYNVMLDELKLFLNPLFLFKINNERTWEYINIDDRHKDLTMYDNFYNAVRAAFQQNIDRKKPWVVCGSVLAVGEVFQYLNITNLVNLGDEIFGTININTI